MKRIIVFSTLLFAALFSTAQVLRPACSSATANMPGCMGKSVLVRNYGFNQLLIHHTSETDNHVHHFAVQNQSTDNYRELVVTLGRRSGNTDTTYRVSDMQVLGDTCYICGTMLCDYGVPILDINGNIVPNTVERYGFIGRLAVTSIAEGGESDFEVYVFDRIAYLTQLSVCNRRLTQADPTRVTLSAIGALNSNNSGHQCVLEAARYPGQGWRYSISYISDNDAETFTDILSTTDMTYLSSFRQDGGDASSNGGWDMVLHGVFGWTIAESHANISGLSESASIYDFGNTGWGWHPRDAKCRLTELPNGRFGLAFGTKNNETGGWGILTATLWGIWQLDTVTLVRADNNLQVNEIEYMPRVNQLAVLARSSRYYNQGVYLPTIGHSGNIPVLSKADMEILSLCRYTGRTLFAGGYDLWSQKVCTFWQHPLTVDQPGCVTVGQSVSTLESPIGGNKLDVMWESFMYLKAFEWHPIPSVIMERSYEMTCSQRLPFVEIDN